MEQVIIAPCPICNSTGSYLAGYHYQCIDCDAIVSRDLIPPEELRLRVTELIQTIDIKRVMITVAFIFCLLAGAALEHYGLLWFLWT